MVASATGKTAEICTFHASAQPQVPTISLQSFFEVLGISFIEYTDSGDVRADFDLSSSG